MLVFIIQVLLTLHIIVFINLHPIFHSLILPFVVYSHVTTPTIKPLITYAIMPKDHTSTFESYSPNSISGAQYSFTVNGCLTI